MNFKQWAEQGVTPPTWGFDDENVDARQLSAAYNKAHIAVEIVRMYDQTMPKGQKLLNNISTIANFNGGAYGLYNSSQNRKVLPPEVRDQIKLQFGEDYLKKYNLGALPRAVLKQYFPQLQDTQIKSGDVINVNIGRIIREFGDSIRAILEIASTIVHEATHEMERETGKPSGESGPQLAERRFMSWASQNLGKIVQKFPELQGMTQGVKPTVPTNPHMEAFDFGKMARTAAATAAIGAGSVLGLQNYLDKMKTPKPQAQQQVDKSEKTVIQQQRHNPVSQAVSVDDHMNFILPHEGSRQYAYDDSRGIRTIGVGMNLDIPASRRRIEAIGLNFKDIYAGKEALSEQQIRQLFAEDVQQAINVARRYTPQLDSLPRNVQLIVVDMTFNLGSLSRFPALREAINNQDWQTAASEMENSRWYKQVGNRSRELVRMMRGVR
jgi:GH24 family phage-related lysozyme (muramidase)